MLSSETRIEIMSKYLNFLGGNYLEIGCWEGGSLCLVDYKMKTKYKKVISVNGIDPFLGSFHVVGIEAVDNKKRNDKGEVNFVKTYKTERNII